MAENIRALLEAQRAYFDTGATRSESFRLLALRQLADAVSARKEELLAALRADLNKHPMEGYMTEVGMVLSEAAYVEKHLSRWMKPQRVKTPLAQFAARSFVLPEPYGAALIMAPWNYPVQLCLEPLIGAIAAGCTAVVKPSAYAPASSAAVARLLRDTFPERYIAAVEGGRAENAALLEEKFDYIFFTGSPAVGRLVMEKAAAHLTPVSLELGGKSPCIVEETADIPLAAKRIAFGKFTNAGQTCVAPDYILCDASVAKPLAAELEKAVAAMWPNGYADFPVIVNDKHYARVTGLLEGQKIAFGGDRDPARRFLAPTVLTGTRWSDPIMQEEIFGPVLPIVTYTELAEALREVRRRPSPLALYLFTRDSAVEEHVLSSVRFGGGCVNDTIIHLATSEMGFGGVGESGMGSYHGRRSFDTFTHYKSIVKKALWFDLPLRYPPYSEKKQRIIEAAMK